jgi:hypothetical protein
MIKLTTKQGRGKIAAAVLFVSLLGWGWCIAVPAESASPAVEAGKLPVAGLTVHNVWVDVPLTQVFRDVSIETGVVIAPCPHVPDPLVSLDAGSGKPLKQCLEELVAGRGLFIYPKTENFYIISCGSPTCPSSLQITTPKRLYLKYISAKHLRSSLPQSLQQYVSSGERVNEVLIYAVPEITEHIMGIVAKLDVPQPQVVLEVLVVDIWENAGEQFGLDWEYTDRHNELSMAHGIGAFTGIARYTSVPKNEVTGLLFTLEALVSEERASIRSRPRVATLNGEKAIIDISLDEYFTIVTNYYGPSLRTELQKIKSGVLLEMTPYIGDNGDITVDVLTEVSDVASRQNQIAGNESGDLPVIRRRKADTNVRVKEGDAIVIGGLIETQEQSKDKRVPILSSLPLIGGLFKTVNSTTVKKEVMIFITPQLIKEGETAFSDSHKLIDADKEIESIQDSAAVSGRQHQHSDSSISIEEEIRCLREVVGLLEGGGRHSDTGMKAGLNEEGEIDAADRRRSLNIAEEIDALREVAALLDIGERNESLLGELP